MNKNQRQRGKYPQGVHYVGRERKFKAQCKKKGKRIDLGLYDSPQAAAKVYNKFKSILIKEVARKQKNEIVKTGLLRHARIFESNSQ